MKAYIDWFEQRGIRVLPIPFDTKDHELYFQMVNGLFLPGTDRGPDRASAIQNETFMNSLRIFYEMSMRKGEYFPIWGTCFGMERLIELIGGKRTWKSFPADGLFPIRISRNTTCSRMIQSFPSSYLDYLEQKKSTLQYHEYGISMEEMKSNPALHKFFSVLATSLDESGKEYVAAIESKHYPIYAVQFHPEQQRTTLPFLDFFRSELKMNSHRCPMLPRVGKVISPHKCAHYEGLKHQMCYFFS
jgi:gamma-glutamyl hydrolase